MTRTSTNTRPSLSLRLILLTRHRLLRIISPVTHSNSNNLIPLNLALVSTPQEEQTTCDQSSTHNTSDNNTSNLPPRQPTRLGCAGARSCGSGS